uniref:Neurotrypsin n=1 Tax=Oncorhynchus tshawytscha TaxID=74940 RepID=A0AAZ3PNU7_ONCTS
MSRLLYNNIMDSVLLSVVTLVVVFASSSYSLSSSDVVPSPSFILPFTDCVQSRGRDGFYQGAVDVTESGVVCMRWSEVAGFEERYPGRGLGDHNRCRNPDNRIRPWCFFRNSRGRTDWGYCDCKQGSVRLQGGRSKLDGRVEVYLQGVWGSVCGDDWGDQDATVVCRQLGQGFPGRARSSALSPRGGVVRMHWGAVHCQGEEPDILQCPSVPWNGGECPHAAGVTCTTMEGRRGVSPLSWEGRVEVFHGGVWGSVCDDQWDESDVEVVCRQLGLGGVARAWGQAYFGAGSGRVWLDEVRCTGNELTLEQCPKAAWGEHNCLHSEDAGASCTPLTDGSVRLSGDSGSSEGRLEVFYRGQWGTVCDDGWTDSNTQVVYTLYTDRDTHTQYLLKSKGPILLDDVSCTGKEPSLSLCSRREWLRHDCSHKEDVNVHCRDKLTHTLHSKITVCVPVRLVGGESVNEGRVEVYLQGTWGTVCDDGWTDVNAEVVCRQLGHSGVAKARVMAYFGEGEGPIHVDNVKCSGEERSLVDCLKQPTGTHNCRHSEDAGVICDYGQSQFSTVESVSDPVCGLRLIHTRQRENYIYILALGDGRLVCGATLISSCWILTSAHCFKRHGNSTKQYKVRVGDYHSLVPEEFEEEYAVDQIVLHPSYRSHSNDYDLALVRLSPGVAGKGRGRCVAFSRHVLPACLPLRKERVLKQASNCHITGWGTQVRWGGSSLPPPPRRHCQQRYHGAFTSRMLCAGTDGQSERRVDSCRGDSGGPLVCERPGGGWVVYGVTSWGHSCRTQHSPGVYTKVSAFTPWIHKVIGQ